MDGVSRGIVHVQAATCNGEGVAAFDNVQSLGGSRFDLSPEEFHAVTEDARGTLHDFGWIEQVRCPFAVDIHLCSGQPAHECSCCSRMIQVDVSSDDVRDCLRIEPGVSNSCKERFYHASGAG